MAKDAILYKKHDFNPFLEEALNTTQFGRFLRRGKNGLEVGCFDLKNNNKLGNFILASEKEHEITEFVKIYADGVRKMLELNAAGLRVFATIELILLNTPKKQQDDKVNLNYMAIKPNCTLQTWNNGIRDLLKHKLIASTETIHLYWINMNCFFRGDRFAFIDVHYLNGSYTKYHEEELTLSGFEEVPKEQ